jgi:hypothetical protein
MADFRLPENETVQIARQTHRASGRSVLHPARCLLPLVTVFI